MIRRALRLMTRLALFVGAALVVSKVVQSRREQQAAPMPFGGVGRVPPPSPPTVKPAVVETAPVEAPPEPTTAETVAENVVVGRSQPPPTEPWVDPDVAGLCPSSHPVKAKLTSGIYHLPGMAAYARTRADRCYCDEETAETDGLRKAKR